MLTGKYLPTLIWFFYGLVLFFIVGWLFAIHWNTLEKIAAVLYLFALTLAFLTELTGQRVGTSTKRVYKPAQLYVMHLLWGLIVVAPIVEHIVDPDNNSLVMAAGMIFHLAGVTLRYSNREILQAYFSGYIGIEETQERLTQGIYRILRHPRHLGIFLQALGLVLILGSWYASILLVALLALLIVRIKSEEWFLTRTLPDYEMYKKVTWRLIPGIW